MKLFQEKKDKLVESAEKLVEDADAAEEHVEGDDTISLANEEPNNMDELLDIYMIYLQYYIYQIRVRISLVYKTWFRLCRHNYNYIQLFDHLRRNRSFHHVGDEFCGGVRRGASSSVFYDCLLILLFQQLRVVHAATATHFRLDIRLQHQARAARVAQAAAQAASTAQAAARAAHSRQLALSTVWFLDCLQENNMAVLLFRSISDAIFQTGYPRCFFQD